MADVAAEAGVSVMSVSYAFGKPDRVSDETRRRVRDAAARLNYTGPHRGAQSLRSGRTNNLGVVLTERLTYAFDDPQARRFLSGIADACLDTDTGLVLLPNRRDGQDVARILDAQVDGYILWTTVVDDPVLDAVVGTGTPVVVQGGPRHDGAELVAIDDVAAAAAVAAHALVGARRPLVLSFPNDRRRIRSTVHGPDPAAATFPVTRNRLEGYRDAVIGAGLDWSRTPVVFVESSYRSEGVRAMAETLDAFRPDAVLAMSDEVALGALSVARERGIAVPTDLSIVGWDDTDEASGAGLTTVAQSLHEQGRSAARFVLGSDEVLANAEWEIVVRGSTRDRFAR